MEVRPREGRLNDVLVNAVSENPAEGRSSGVGEEVGEDEVRLRYSTSEIASNTETNGFREKIVSCELAIASNTESPVRRNFLDHEY